MKTTSRPRLLRDSKYDEVNVISRPLFFSRYWFYWLNQRHSLLVAVVKKQRVCSMPWLPMNGEQRLDYDVDESNLDESLCLFNQQVAQIAIYPVVMSNEKPSVDFFQ
jgi:hypothetical protein